MDIRSLIKNLNEIISVSGSTNCKVLNVTGDSRQVQAGTLFVAVPGMKVDGHDFISQALDKGAVAVIGEKNLKLDDGKTYIRVKSSRIALAETSSWFYGYPAEKLKIIGVTGTNGKTTITYLIQAILNKVGAKTGVIGTIGNVIRDEKLPAKYTTPEAPELHKLMYDMLKQQVEYVTMEVSSHSLKLHRVDGIDFELGIFTNLTQDHLDIHGTIEDYF
ncbi:MAG: UDP-N-acetylmuramoyl-L-alanyl-D-glutamate--2,6-diaminopimelate ligase, partial [Clostridiaceae bacterium]|nr:UDP-N-acetylmuramoyl-L-alanyl-D-glutamate--2,6-diaminopimelate ligase [Clostridiaceae bacterium]